MIILGIDPGVAIVGWGVIESDRGRVRPIAYGAITTPAHTALSNRLQLIYHDTRQLLDMFKPDAVSIDELFFNTNITTGIAVAHGRGVILLACQEAGVI